MITSFKKTLILFVFLFIGTASAQDYLFFTDSDITSYYDPSWVFASAPSSLEAINSSKFPVSVDTFYSGTNALKLKWKSSINGDWGAAIAVPGWPGRDVTMKDTLSFWVYSAQLILSANLPKIYLEDLANQKTGKINLSDYCRDIQPGVWTKLIIPISIFAASPGTADLTKIKTIFWGQSSTEGIERTLFIDNVRMTGGKNSNLYKNIVVLGSSTAAGTGTTSPDSAWVNRFRKYVSALDTSFRVINLAVGGYTTYDVMPTSFVPPAGRPTPKIYNNISYALEFNPYEIIVNLPSNDASSGFSISEQIRNYDTLVSIARDRNIKLWISTTQPRNFSLQSQLNLLFAMRDSTYSKYGEKAIDFWTDIAQSNGFINPIYGSGDGIHLNNAAHRLLFERVVQRVANTLPVEFINFSASTQKESSKIILEWETATETNNRGFEIEKSFDKIKFVTIGFITGSGTSSDVHSYFFADNTKSRGVSFYRLKQVDFNGKYSFSNIIEVNLSPTEYSLSQNYPNPFNPSTVISWQLAASGFVSLKVYDVLGNEVAALVNEEKQPGSYKVFFDTQQKTNNTQLTSGVYFYQLRAGDFIQTKKMIVLK